MLGSMVTLLLVIHTGTICATGTVIHITGIRGTSIHLSLELPPGFNTRDIFWRHMSPTDHLVASFSRRFPDTSYQSRFHGRVHLLHNFTLEILELDLGDTGEFTCQAVDTEGHMELHQFHLTVHEAVVKPEIQVFVSRGSANCTVFLSCGTTVGTNVTYSWVIDSRPGISRNSTYSLLDDSRLLRILLAPTEREVSFTCTVTNPVSQEQATVVLWASCSFHPGADSSKIILCIGIILTLAFISLVFCVYLCTRNSGKYTVRKRQRDKEDPEQQDEETAIQANEETVARQNDTSLLHDIETEV